VSAAATNRRIVVLAAVFALLLGATLARAFWLQGIEGAKYAALAIAQHRETVTVPAGRGTIFDRTGDPLAIGERAITIYANPKQVVHPRTATLEIARVLRLDPNVLYPLLSNRSKGFVYVERKAESVKAAALERKHIPGLGFYPEEQRTYPQDRVASQVLGFAGMDNVGLEGLERSLNPVLEGKAGSETIVKDPAGRALSVVSTRTEEPGKNVRLTIDSQIQAYAQQVLEQTIRQWSAKDATAIVMDPSTGAIYAMAVAPGFNANRFATTRADRHRNRAVTDTYEPGSTFKLVTISAALQDHLVTPRTSFVLAPTFQVADRVIHDAEPRGTERMTVAQIVARSSNIGTDTIARRLGAGRLADWIDRWGFGHPTGIDFPGESPGFALPLDQWSGSTIGTVPIGQGISVTPLQMARAYSAIANGGRLVTPYLVDKVGGRTIRHRRGHRVVSRRVSKEMMSMLRGVVLEGTGTAAAIPGYTVAGKTGTAAKVDPNGRYSTTNYVASFVGMVPATKPRLVIMAMVDEPRGAIWGGVVAAPAFQQIARFCLQHLEVPPDAPQTARN